MPRNGNGHEGRNGGREAVPRWVRTLFDHHEAHMAQMERKREEDKAEHEERMAEMERKREEDKAEHEARMDRMDRMIDKLDRGLVDSRRHMGRIVALTDALRRDHDLLVKVVREVHGRVSRLEAR